MEIIRNVYYEGKYEGAYLLYKRDGKYYWQYVKESFVDRQPKEEFKQIPNLHIKTKRHWRYTGGTAFNISGDIPYEDGDLEDSI